MPGHALGLEHGGYTGIVRFVAVLLSFVVAHRVVGFRVFGVALVAGFVDGSLADGGCSTHVWMGLGGIED